MFYNYLCPKQKTECAKLCNIFHDNPRPRKVLCERTRTSASNKSTITIEVWESSQGFEAYERRLHQRLSTSLSAQLGEHIYGHVPLAGLLLPPCSVCMENICVPLPLISIKFAICWLRAGGRSSSRCPSSQRRDTSPCPCRAEVGATQGSTTTTLAANVW